MGNGLCAVGPGPGAAVGGARASPGCLASPAVPQHTLHTIIMMGALAEARGGGKCYFCWPCGSVTNPILRTPARCAAAMAWATNS